MLMPRSPGRVKLSPEILSTTRPKGLRPAGWCGMAIGFAIMRPSYSLPEFPVDEPLDRHAVFLGHLADGLLVVLDERLLQQDLLGVEVAQPPFDHLVDDVLGLAFLERRLAQDRTLLVDHGRIQVLAVKASGRMAAMCMQMSLATSGAAFDLQQHARDRRRVVAVAAASPVDPHHPPTLNTSRMRLNRSSFCSPQRRAGLAGRRLGQQFVGRLGTGTGRQLPGQVVGQLDELLVLRHRGAFALQFDHRADRRIETGVDAESAERRLAARPAW